MKFLSLIVWAGVVLFASNVVADSITLKNGEVIQGQIISETDAQIIIESTNRARTIVSHQTVSKSDIKNIERETPEQKKERLAYEALDRLKLDPNQEWSKAQYTSGIDAFNDFLTAYPGSKFNEEVSARQSLWTNELAHVEQGQVKLNDQWMSPADKRVSVAANTVAYLKLRMVDFQKRHEDTVKAINDTQTAIQQDQLTANNPPTKYVEGHQTYQAVQVNRPGSGGGYVSRPSGYEPGHYIADTDASQNAARSVVADGDQLNRLQAQLKSIEDEIDNISRRLPEAEAQYKAALELQKASQPPTPMTR